ncbi:hypothetical protein A3G67_00220 [Candidatus Roizmanbacteria bacterium RIFCSPLOWO2_12_FULL_40_12]|uniref:ATP-grasp domain-containing protein n=1 Tax=Candidatus Roizmanbacteria bacterium RIFCSPLOWO2_01_FULL_40_42 TaxID=1802066 RepID=A0A1F7J590_9BACT|nr:MAG: hypothetical protein A2779_01640 [Candidatus Roizmanbacteria bacterium RIFCSPHIGHO2_01_FULL_40_98]OGK28688.1 MAG: hypothetical protein A3C31_02890 [Candidatus Roizmanbacteria bacterium RIFCSPHIGHO2_02_FULL_40_53]OGK29514.1 MAG: hypothetical protein A2W49_04960 [Candidatus Roizmanbacteria bacterium RIFCSPHIGHO2_12_41_18]OGK36808.1 MAG: hypothetical protein A3E69_03945 [Candidatus Roizmanbacteria bacterium RIFCSPHIGHO2_12_FULL_40_130]OGK50771.1 MAG: hypothetical protein A3B50_02895 [Candi
MSAYCKYCWPSKTKSHLNNHIEYYHDKLLGKFLKRKKQSNFWGKFLEILAKINIVKFVSNPDDSNLYNRSLIFFKEAKKRGLNVSAIQAFGKYDNTFKYILNDQAIYYDGIPLNRIGDPIIDLDNKIEIKKILQKNNLPVSTGGYFTKLDEAIQFSHLLTYPLIVKPNNGSLSHHVIGPIKNEQELRKAIEIVQLYRPDFIIEEYIVGRLYRATVIGKKHVFICEKDPANIIGNGQSTIAQLISKKNSKRGKKDQFDSTLHEIPIDNVLKSKLQFLQLNLKSILPKSKKIYLHEKFVLNAGCDIISRTTSTHQENKKLFLKVAQVLDVDIVGIDFICADIERPWNKQKSAIIETNSLPYVDMHQYPSQGVPDPVAKVVWDHILASK